MKPLDLLITQMNMYYVNRSIGFIPSSSPKNFTIPKCQNRYRFAKIRNSLEKYCFVGNDCESFKNNYDSQELYRNLDEYEQVLFDFFEHMENGIIENVRDDIFSGNYNCLTDYVKMISEAQFAWDEMMKIENCVKRWCVFDWKRNLTAPDTISEETVLEKYSFIIQAVYNCNPAWIMKGPAVSASLVTSEMPYTYQNRQIGIIYQLTEDNLISLATADANSNVTQLVSDEDLVSSLLNKKLIENRYNVEFIEDFDTWFYLYAEFIKRWKDRIVKTDDGTKPFCNEILLKPDFLNDVIGVITFQDATAYEKEKASKLAVLFKVPLFAYNDKKVLQRID